MRRPDEQITKLAAFTGVLLMAVGEAMAQENRPRAARRIVVSIPDRKLAILEDGKILKAWSTAVGAPRTPSPAGSFAVVVRITDPTWYYKGRIVAPGKANPLGTRWLGLSAAGYGIHGTNAPSSIGRNASHGCIRMRNRDVEELFEMVAVGDAVELYDERTEEIERIFGTAPAKVQVQVASAQPVALKAEPAGEAQ
jgi:lipoprotein-anchoring transpeptidase ErfK/SrfK